MGQQPADPADAATGPERRADLFRFPGGSSSDDYHFNDPASYAGKLTVPDFAKFIESEGGQGLVTLDYGSGSPQEAAAFLAYLNAPVGNTTAIGVGPEWSDSSNQWVTTDWKTAGYWASLRASTPLAQDDGLNFLRIGHAAPFAFHDYEVGNEEYGSWEIDHHTQQHDPATYIAFAKSFATYAASIDPTISIGLDVGSVSQDNNWTPNILQQSVAQGFTPGFLSDHHYVQAPGQESDANLLLNTGSSTGTQDPTNPENWARPRRRLPGPAPADPRGEGRRGPVARHRVQLGLFQPRQADDQPGQRPVPGRLARQPAQHRVQRRHRLGPPEQLRHRATTTPAASTAGGKGAITASSAAATPRRRRRA